MLSFLLGLHFLLAIAIIGLILLQKHDSDGALGSSGGGAASGMFSVRGQANLLTRATGILMAIFVINCLTMAKIAKNSHMTGRKESLIDKVARESIKPTEQDMTKPSKPADNQSPAQKPSDNKTDSVPATPAPVPVQNKPEPKPAPGNPKPSK